MSAKEEKVAIVTGANKGIGFAVVKGLAEQFDGVIYLTARNVELGLEALNKLTPKYGSKVKFHQLDVVDKESVAKFGDFIRSNHNGVDILVNNAGIVYHDNEKNEIPIVQKVKNVIGCNFNGVLNVNNEFSGLLKDNARVVNVSSDWGLLVYVVNKEFQKRFQDESLNVEGITKVVNDYVQAAQDESYDHKSFEPYKISKTALNALTREQQKGFDNDSTRKGIIVSAVHPGEVLTDMNSGGNISADEGAETILYVALLPPDASVPKGAYWYKKHVYNWSDLNIDLKTFV